MVGRWWSVVTAETGWYVGVIEEKDDVAQGKEPEQDMSKERSAWSLERVMMTGVPVRVDAISRRLFDG